MRRSGFDGSGLRSWASYTFLRVLVRASVYAEFNTAYRVMRRRGHRVRGHRRRFESGRCGGKGDGGGRTCHGGGHDARAIIISAHRRRRSALAAAANKWFAQQCARRATTDPYTQCYVLFMRYNYIMIIIILRPCFTPLGVANRRSNYYYYTLYIPMIIIIRISYSAVDLSGLPAEY